VVIVGLLLRPPLVARLSPSLAVGHGFAVGLLVGRLRWWGWFENNGFLVHDFEGTHWFSCSQGYHMRCAVHDGHLGSSLRCQVVKGMGCGQSSFHQ
jgi:hypothetical protein